MWQKFLDFIASLFSSVSAPPAPKPVEPKPPADVIPFPTKPTNPSERGSPAWYEAEFAKSEVRPEWGMRVKSAARLIESGRERYEEAARVIGCPWRFVGVIDNLESGCDPMAVLHNGERIIGTGKKTKLVPAGKGPFETWPEAAIDALKGYKGMSDWSLGMQLKRLEAFNGQGYFRRGIPSPYLWSGTTTYTKGKYVADGVFDADAVSKQVGAAAIFKELDA